MCGVSRGTVDRVLNNRGNVKPEKRKRVLEVMRELNYQPNPAGKALAARKHKPVVGILLPSEGIVFFDDVLETMHRMARRYEDYGVRFVWRLLRGYHADEQCAAIEELRHEVNALIVNPMSEPAVIQKIDECAHHVPEETVCLDGEHEIVALGAWVAHHPDMVGSPDFPSGIRYGTDGCLVVAAYFLEAPEIMRARQKSRGFVHRINIQAEGTEIRKLFYERVFLPV